MNEEISVSVSLPLDNDGFLRRECPNCEQEFKWFSHAEGDPDAEPVSQYFCPLCGVAADLGSWWTPEQLEYAQRIAGPELDRIVQDTVRDAFKGTKGLSFKPNRNFSFGIETPEPLTEADDMIIVEPPCHPNEPLKVPADAANNVHCLVCGTAFAT